MELFHLTVSHSIEFESYIFQFQGFFSIEVADTIDLYTLQIRGCDIERQVLNVFTFFCLYSITNVSPFTVTFVLSTYSKGPSIRQE